MMKVFVMGGKGEMGEGVRGVFGYEGVDGVGLGLSEGGMVKMFWDWMSFSGRG